MSAASSEQVTALLAAWRQGSSDAEARLMAAVYGQLRLIAASYLRRERPGHTLQPTALVHEAYIRLVGQHQLDWRSRGHLFAIASREMRRILVEHARKRRAAKREGFAGQKVTLAGMADAAAAEGIDVLSLDEAMSE